MSQKVIIPKGLINPNETTVVEIPGTLQHVRTVIATLPVNGQRKRLAVFHHRQAGGSDAGAGCVPCGGSRGSSPNRSADISDFDPPLYSSPKRGEAPSMKGHKGYKTYQPSDLSFKLAYAKKFGPQEESSIYPEMYGFEQSDPGAEDPGYEPSIEVPGYEEPDEQYQDEYKDLFGVSYDPLVDPFNPEFYPEAKTPSPKPARRDPRAGIKAAKALVGGAGLPTGGPTTRFLQRRMEEMAKRDKEEMRNVMKDLDSFHASRRELVGKVRYMRAQDLLQDSML